MDRRWLGYSAFRELQTKHSSIVSQAKRVIRGIGKSGLQLKLVTLEYKENKISRGELALLVLPP